MLPRNGTNWVWPADDSKLALVFDHVSDIDIIMQYVDKKGVCVQAGGATGVWPSRFADFFQTVLTFEPDPVNYQCLLKNTADKTNIIATHAALGDRRKNIRVVRDMNHQDNFGAGYVIDGGDVPMITIDGLELSECGLIQLDIEGHELEALRGATSTLLKFRPVVVLEEKQLPHVSRDHKEAGEFLRAMGYRQKASFHRDVLFSC